MQQQNPISGDPHQYRLPIQIAGIFLVGLLALAMFQSSALLTLTYDLEPGALNERIVVQAEIWHGWMEALGTAGITETLSEIIQSAHDAPLS